MEGQSMEHVSLAPRNVKRAPAKDENRDIGKELEEEMKRQAEGEERIGQLTKGIETTKSSGNIPLDASEFETPRADDKKSATA